MVFNKKVLCCVFVMTWCSTFRLTESQWVVDDEGCPTPFNDVGTCITIKECQPMVDFLDSKEEMTESTTNILSQYQCGYEQNEVKVCCPDGPIVVEGPKTPTVVETRLSDKNTNLVPEWVIDDEGCRTPYRGVGTCILIKECQPMINFLQSSPSITPSVINILRQYQCGFERTEVKVCCPDGPIQVAVRNPIGNELGHKSLNLLPSDCGLLNGGNRIINGERTALFEFPWMTLLSYQTRDGVDFRCGGTVINDRYILTAAHCITNLSDLKLLGVRCGEHNITSDFDCEGIENPEFQVCAPPVQDMPIETTIPHPDYNPTTYSNDIGLIRLGKPLNMTVENVKPICLPTSESLKNLNFTSQRLIVTGWGTTETGRRSSLLLKVEIAVTSPESCKKAYASTPAQLSDKQICAGGRNKRDSCGGDSGGPIQRIDSYNDDARFVQYGVVSFGHRFCGQEGFPGVYTRTDSYISWILDNLQP